MVKQSGLATAYTDGQTCPVPDDLLGRLYKGGRPQAVEIVSTLPEVQRARLAEFCYARTHLRELGLSIATTCSEDALVAAAGTLGGFLHKQAQSPTTLWEAESAPAKPEKARISLAQVRSA